MTTFELGGARFRQSVAAPSQRGVSHEDEFLLVKTDSMLAFYRSLQASNPRTIMEIGMYEGGSLVFFDKLYRPDRIVGLDLRREPIAPLESYRAANPQVVTYYGRHQDKDGTLAAARTNFPQGIDLVVDDASHLYAQTRATFAMLFPLVRPGGHYVIEDWTWSHRPAYQGPAGTWADQPALTNLVFEIVVMAATCPVIESVHVDRNLLSIRKGTGAFRPEMMDLSGVLRGRAMPQV